MPSLRRASSAPARLGSAQAAAMNNLIAAMAAMSMYREPMNVNRVSPQRPKRKRSPTVRRSPNRRSPKRARR